MESNETMPLVPTSVTSFIIDEDGDLILVVGSDIQHRILVSSKILTISSKVFKAMLSRSKFKEGRELAKSLVDNRVYELPLLDDDAKAMRALCQLLYHRSQEIKVADLTINFIHALAVLADKYDCINAVGPICSPWLPKVLNDQNSLFVLSTSYILDDAEQFRETSRAVILEANPKYLEFICVQDQSEERMPEGVLPLLLDKQTHLLKFTSTLIGITIDSMSQGDINLDHYHGQHASRHTPNRTFSRHDAARLAVFSRELREKVKWPQDLVNQQASVGKVLERLRAIKDTQTGYTHRPDSGYCQACKMTVHEIVEEIVKTVLGKAKGLCLDCVKREGGSTHCRIPH